MRASTHHVNYGHVSIWLRCPNSSTAVSIERDGSKHMCTHLQIQRGTLSCEGQRTPCSRQHAAGLVQIGGRGTLPTTADKRAAYKHPRTADPHRCSPRTCCSTYRTCPGLPINPASAKIRGWIPVGCRHQRFCSVLSSTLIYSPRSDVTTPRTLDPSSFGTCRNQSANEGGGALLEITNCCRPDSYGQNFHRMQLHSTQVTCLHSTVLLCTAASCGRRCANGQHVTEPVAKVMEMGPTTCTGLKPPQATHMVVSQGEVNVHARLTQHAHVLRQEIKMHSFATFCTSLAVASKEVALV